MSQNFHMTTEFQKSAALFELAKILGQQNDFQEIVRLISSTATALFNAEIASIMMINPSTQETIKTIFKGGKEIAAAPYQYVQNVVVGWAMKHQRAFLSADLQTDARFDQEAFAGEAVRAAMCVLFMSQGRALGYMLVLSENEAAAFDEAALHLLENLAAVCTPFLSNVQRIQEYFNAPLPEVALLGQFEPLGLIGKSKPFIELLRAVEAASRCDVRVLLEGQSERREDIPLLANHFLKKFADEQKKPVELFENSLLNFLQQRQWSGNVRELENFVERLVTLAAPEAVVVTSKTIPAEFQSELQSAAVFEDDIARKSLQQKVNDFEAQLIRQALEESQWNQSQAARLLGTAEYTIRYKMEKLGIAKPAPKRRS